MIQQIDESLILGYLEKITSFGPHVTGTRKIDDVGDYIYNEFQSMGLKVRYQSWRTRIPYLKRPLIWHGWYNGNNIEATLPSADETNDKIFIISAHYDSWRRSPGAVDDGSGVAAVLSIAKVMSQYTFNHTIRFVTFSGEEQGLLGSYSYSEEAYSNNDNIIAVFNADQMGAVDTEDGGSKVWVIRNEPSEWLTEFTINISQRYSEYINLEIIPQDISSGHVSDNVNFWQFGYAAVHYHEIPGQKRYIHSPDDTIENMNIPYAKKVTKLIMATLAEFALDNQSEWPDPSPASMPINQQSVTGLQKLLEKFPILERILSSISYFSRILRL